MRAIDDYRQVFDRLQASWDTLTLLGQLSGNATEMSGTRSAFETLTASLLGHLAKETRDKAMADLRIKAQNAIDVLVRNLFERTADIGFLSTDTAVREFMQASAPSRHTPPTFSNRPSIPFGAASRSARWLVNSRKARPREASSAGRLARSRAAV